MKVSLATVLIAAALAMPLAPGSTAAPAGVTLDLTGDAGDWTFIHVTFASPVARADFAATLDAASDGAAGDVLFVSPIAPIIAANDAANPSPVEPVVIDGAASFQQVGAKSVPSVVAGYWFAIGATHAWTASLASPLPAASIARMDGEGLQAIAGDVEAVTGGLRLTLDATLGSAGWSHLAIRGCDGFNTGVRSHDIAFPGGYSYNPSAHIPTPWGTDAGTAVINRVGSIADAAGDFNATVTVAAAGSPPVSLTLVSLPGFSLPEGVANEVYSTGPRSTLGVPDPACL